MPQIGFVCPDGAKVGHHDCLTACRMGQRCLTKSTLAAMAVTRLWTGTPSTTQLIAPTCMEWLKITCDYHADPQDMAFMFIGTRAHRKLQDSDTDVSILEERFHEQGMTGIADCYEYEDGEGVLTDYKTWGSYAVAKALGLRMHKWDEPSLTETYKSGPRKGQPRVKVMRRLEQRAEWVDMHEAEWQLNRYRVFYESAGFRVDRMQVQAFVRDGGILAAKRSGIDRRIYLMPVRRIDNAIVERYFEARMALLSGAVANHELPDQCTQEERWEGKRCASYCPVADQCPYLQAELLEAGEDEESL